VYARQIDGLINRVFDGNQCLVSRIDESNFFIEFHLLSYNNNNNNNNNNKNNKINNINKIKIIKIIKIKIIIVFKTFLFILIIFHMNIYKTI